MMKTVNGEELYSRLKKQAFNSSHYVWLWSDLKFFESSNGWIFGVTKELGVNLVALEPLPPVKEEANNEESFSRALEELQSFFQEGPIAFVGIYTPFAQKLTKYGFSSFQVGKEPWVNLSDIQPTGHAGRKVRVGRNQALKSGLRVEEWKLTEVIKDPEKLATLNEVKKLWEAQSFVSLSGFLHGMSFEFIPEDRKCFVALTKENVVDGILIVTPIVSEKSWYFEDMLIRTSSSASRGIGELLTLSAMEALQAIGHKEISLGIVPMTTVGTCEFGEAPPANFLRLSKAFQSSMGMFYNAEGMELFRKRFKVVRWDKIYLSVLADKKSSRPETLQWITVLMSITAAYKPSLQLEPSYVADKLVSPLKRCPTSYAFLFLSLITFYLTSKVPALASFFTSNLEFSKDVATWQWPLRTLSSELIYFSTLQFWVLFGLITTVLFHIEKEVFDKKWALYLLGFFLMSDIVLRTSLGVIYNNLYHSESLTTLINLFPSNGGETLLASLLGFAVTLQGPKKDEWFAGGLLGFITLSFILPSFGISSLAPLYCITFFISGYFAGKFYLSYQSQKDALINKNKSAEDDDVTENTQTNKGQNKAARQNGEKQNQKKAPAQSQKNKNDFIEELPIAANSNS